MVSIIGQYHRRRNSARAMRAQYIIYFYYVLFIFDVFWAFHV